MNGYRSAAAAAALACLLPGAPAAAGPGLLGPDNPPYASGRVVDSTSGTALAGVVVEYRDIATLAPLRGDTTDRRGAFRVNRLPADVEEEYALWVDGSAVGHESGYVGCGFEVVATWGEACSIGSGRYSSDVLLDPLP